MITEEERLAVLRRFNILDTDPEPQFDAIVQLVRCICAVPIALVSLVDQDRQWFKARSGVTAHQTSLNTSVCALAIRQGNLFQIEDLEADPRTSGMSLVTGEPRIRFYAGYPLVARNGAAIGTLCAIDLEPRPDGLDPRQQEALEILAGHVLTLLEIRNAVEHREEALVRSETARAAQSLEDRYHTIVDSAIDSAILALDADGHVTSWSSGAERLFGWTEAEMLGAASDRIFTPEDQTAGIPTREIETARRSGRASDERWHQHKDGSRFFGHGALTTLKSGDGFVKALRDITKEHDMRRALELSRDQSELAMRSARLGRFDYRLQEDSLEWDDRCRAVFGLSPGSPVSYDAVFLRGIHPDDRASADAAVQAALDPTGSGTFEAEYRTVGIEDGKLRHVSARGQTYFESGSAARLVGVIQDVTEARVAEQKRREIEERLRLAGRATNDAIWDWDLVNNTVLWNEALHTAYGHAPEAVDPTGEWWIAHIHEDDRERIDREIHAVIDSKDTDWRGDYRFLRADGSYADVRDRGYVIRDDQGSAVRMVGAMLDQSDRVELQRRLEASLDESAAELDRLWRYSPDLQIAMTNTGTILQVNAAWTSILGYAPETLEGRSVLDFVHPDDLTHTIETLDRAGAGPLGPLENRFVAKDGNPHWISWVAAPSGSMVFATGRDVTLQKQQQETLRQTEEALRQSQKVEAVGQLTGGVAHDFNNLLTVIRGSVDLLRRSNLNEDRRIRYIDAISDTTERAMRLTSQLLAFARRQTLQPKVFDAAASVHALQDMLRTLTGSRVTIHYQLPDEACFINADPSQFDTAIVNMVANARDAMDDEGVLAIKVQHVDQMPAVRKHAAVPGGFIAVSIIDTGTGIAPDKLEHIFEPFFTTKGVGHGTGLGLSQVFGFAKQSGGEVMVESELGRGSTFTLYLPFATSEQHDAEQPRRVGRTLEPGACVLLVEDNPDVGAFATQALGELGYGSHWSMSADEALDALAASPDAFDVAFTDVVMPGRSGIELAEEIRRLYPNLPIVLTSGYSHVLAQKGVSGFDLLQKPYSIDELAQVLRSVSDRNT